MAEPYDQAFKLTAEAETRGLLEYFAGVILDSRAEFEELDGELTLGTRRVDQLYRVQKTGRPALLHMESFTEYPRDWEDRHLTYACLIWAKYKLPFCTVSFLLTRRNVPAEIPESISIDADCFHMNQQLIVVRMWEVPARKVLESKNPILCVWVPLTDSTDAERREAFATVAAHPDPDLVTRMKLLAGLRYLEKEVEEMFSEELVKESSVYKGWKERFTKEGLERGLEQGIEQGRLDGERLLLRRQLERRFASLSESVESRLREASQETLERWAIQLLTAGSIEDALR